MSTNLIKQQIRNFLTTSKPEVLAIKGRWGVGKTYTWDSHIEEFKSICELKSYSYVSLFGINSIDALKQSTFLNTVDINTVGEKKNTKAHAKFWADKLKNVKIPVLSKYISGVGDVISSLSQLALKDTIICFDDLERHSEGLKIKDFMGLVSYLKERRNCKIILLLNEDSTDSSFKDYVKFKEKIVDKQLHFEPTAGQSFDAMSSDDYEFKSYVRDCCVGLNIKNKRVIRKIVSHVKEFLSKLGPFDNDIKQQIIHSTVVFSWCYYCHGEDEERIPAFAFVNRRGLRKADEKKGWDETISKKWDDLLNSYNFSHADEIDFAVAEGIEQGFLDEEKLIPLCEQKQNELNVQKKSASWEEAWNIFHNSFDANEDEVAIAIDKGMRDIAPTASCSQYSSGLKILRGIGRDEAADNLIEYFIDRRKETPEAFDIDNFITHPFGIEDEKFKERLRSAYVELKPKPTVLEVLNLRKKSNSYNDSEVEILNELSEKEIFDLIMSIKGEELDDFVRVFMLLASSSEELKSKVKNVLDKISKTSKLNELRMVKFYRK